MVEAKQAISLVWLPFQYIWIISWLTTLNVTWKRNWFKARFSERIMIYHHWCLFCSILDQRKLCVPFAIIILDIQRRISSTINQFTRSKRLLLLEIIIFQFVTWNGQSFHRVFKLVFWCESILDILTKFNLLKNVRECQMPNCWVCINIALNQFVQNNFHQFFV